MKKVILLVLTLLVISSTLSFAADNYVTVNIPSFDVRVNDVKFDSSEETYPFLVYKGITYLPMTWDMSQALGLSLKWSNENGLVINKGTSSKVVAPEGGGSYLYSKTYQAKVVTDKVTVNGRVIDNQAETYPLLNFKGITYFPMTYSFMVNTFDCRYKWDDKTGFSIQADPSVEQSISPPKTFTYSFSKKELETNKNMVKGLAKYTNNVTNYGFTMVTSEYAKYKDSFMDMEFTIKDVNDKEIYSSNPVRGKFFPENIPAFDGASVIKDIDFSHIDVTFRIFNKTLFEKYNEELLQTYMYEEIDPEDFTIQRLVKDGAYAVFGLNVDSFEVPYIKDNIHHHLRSRSRFHSSKGDLPVLRRNLLNGQVVYDPEELIPVKNFNSITLNSTGFFIFHGNSGRGMHGDLVLLYNENQKIYKIYHLKY